MKFIDLSKVLKAGDTVNDVTRGKTIITEIDYDNGMYCIECSNKRTYTRTYTREGKYRLDDKYPSIYIQEPELPFEYEPEIYQDLKLLFKHKPNTHPRMGMSNKHFQLLLKILKIKTNK